MAVKVKKQEEVLEVVETGTEIVEASSGGGILDLIMSGEACEVETKVSVDFPSVQYHWLIQDELENPDHFNVWYNGNYSPLLGNTDGGYLVSVLATKKVIRQRVKGDNNQSRNNWVYRNSENYQEMMALVKAKDADTKEGVDLLVAINDKTTAEELGINHTNGWYLARIRAAASAASYLEPIMTNGDIKNRNAVEVLISSHKGNREKTKDGNGSYLARPKFTQRRKESLSDADMAAIRSLMDAKKEDIENFVNQ